MSSIIQALFKKLKFSPIWVGKKKKKEKREMTKNVQFA